MKGDIPLMFLRKYWFLLGIGTALVCGYFFSSKGLTLNPKNVSSTGIIIILFFIAGLTLPSDSIRAGLKEYKLHLYIQLFIYVFVPVFIFFTTLPLRGIIDNRVLIGLYAVACLPTTISSCIVFTQISGGNVIGSMFNSALANILGIVVSPLLLSVMVRGAGTFMAGSELVRILLSLGYKMFLPVASGQLVRLVVRNWISKAGPYLKTVSNALIIILIFFSFSKAAANPLFTAYIKKMIFPFSYLACVHIFFIFAAYRGGKLLRESTISAMYTASQKSVAMGVPFLTTFFSDSPEIVGVVILPVVFYHSWQLLTAGVVRTLPFIREKETPRQRGR